MISRTNNRHRAILTTLSATLLATACGGDRENGSERKSAETEAASAPAGPAPAPSPTAPQAKEDKSARLLLLGIDGATWDLMDPLLAEGALPHFARLLANGSRGPLKTFEPTLSPLIWTTIATGVGPQKHGIRDFVAPIPGTDRRAIVTSNMRKVHALWNLLSDQGIEVGVVGWWATYPAEEVRGFVISDQANDLRRVNYLRAVHENTEGAAPAAADPRGVHPPDVAAAVKVALQLDPTISQEELARFFELPEGRADLLTQPLGDDEDLLSIFKFSYLIDKSFLGAALVALEREQPEFAAVYLNGLDAAEHHFWKFMEPSAFQGVLPKDAARYGKVIRNYYAYVDEALGRLLDLYPLDKTTVVVVSDHGHEKNPGHDTKSKDHFHRVCSGTHEKAPPGIVIVAGRDAARGADLAGATVIDVAPTVLGLLGAKVPEEMPGRILEMAIAPERLKRTPPKRAPIPLARPDSSDVPIPSTMGDALETKLRGLGYIQ